MLTVLIVDDEPFILEGLELIIKWEDYGLKVAGKAENGAEAIEFIHNNHVDVLISDITMPQMNGLELINKVKEDYPKIKCVVLSGYNDFEYVKEGIKLGIENYLLKPVSVAELIATIQNIVNKIEKANIISKFEESDYKILRNNILFRWVTNNIDTFELEERAELLELNLKKEFYLVCSINVFDDNMVEQSNSSSANIDIYNYIEKSFKSFTETVMRNICTTCFYDFDGDIIVIFGSKSLGTRLAIVNKLNEERRNIKIKYKKNVLITVGDFQTSYTKVFQSYNNAKKLKDFSLIHHNDFIIDYDELNKITSQKSLQPKINSDELLKIVINGTEQDISNYIDVIYDNFINYRQATPYDILNYTIEIILVIKKITRQFDDTNDYANIFKSILKFQTIDQVKKYVKSFAICNSADYESKAAKYSPIVRQMITYVNNHLSEDISLKLLGEVLNANSTYIGQIFKKETGEFFTDYVNKQKMGNAKKLVLESNLKIPDICFKLGYENQNYFYTQFKKYNGASPAELRGYKKK